MLLLITVLAASCGPATPASGATAPAATTPSAVAHPGTTGAAGQLAWKFKAGDRAGDPAISGGLVYVVGNDGANPEDKGFAASLHALDEATGTERWQFAMPGDSVDSAPVVSGGLVFVGTWGTYVYALDAATGAVRWKQKTGLEIHSTPAVSEGLLCVAGIGSNSEAYESERPDSGGMNSTEFVCALDAATGAERWRFNSAGPLFSSPVVSGGSVYAASSEATDYSDTPEDESSPGFLYALDAASGTERWKFPTGPSGESPAVSGGLVYAGDLGGYLHALDAASGTERWKSSVEDGAGPPTVSDGAVYVGGTDGYVYALDAASGAQRWRCKTLFWASNPPAASADLVYAVARDHSGDAGYVYALDPVSGAQRWQFEATGIGDSSPVVSGDLVYVGSSDGDLYAVATRSGVPSPATTIAPPSTTTMETLTTAGNDDTESSTESTMAAAPEVVKYMSDFMAWFFLYGTTSRLDLDRLEEHLSDEDDVTTLTAADLQVVDRATVHLHELSSLLRSIEAPEEAAGVHQKLVAGFDAEVALQDKELLAMRNKDQAGVDAALSADPFDDRTGFNSAMNEWMDKYGVLSGWWGSGSESPPTTLPTSQYEAAVMAWVEAFREWAGIGTGFEMSLETYGDMLSDPAEVARAHGFGNELHAIQPPAALAAVHQKLVAGFDAWLVVVDKALAGGKAPSQAVIESLRTEYDNTETAYQGAMEDWLIAQFPSFPLPFE
jgi:eukaryotic-like serine/threonine-protein kinase